MEAGVVSKRLDERSYQVETATNTQSANRSTEQPQTGTECEAPADDQNRQHTHRPMTVVTPPEPVIRSSSKSTSTLRRVIRLNDDTVSTTRIMSAAINAHIQRGYGCLPTHPLR